MKRPGSPSLSDRPSKLRRIDPDDVFAASKEVLDVLSLPTTLLADSDCWLAANVWMVWPLTGDKLKCRLSCRGQVTVQVTMRGQQAAKVNAHLREMQGKVVKITLRGATVDVGTKIHGCAPFQLNLGEDLLLLKPDGELVDFRLRE